MSDTTSRSASARNPPSSSERSGSSNRCRMSTPYFAGEVRRADAAELQLQDELADEPLFVIGPVRAAQWKRPVADFRAVGLPLVEVLHVHAVDVAERRHAEAGQIGALPQPIAIDELRALGIPARPCTRCRSVYPAFCSASNASSTQRRLVSQSATGAMSLPLRLHFVDRSPY